MSPGRALFYVHLIVGLAVGALLSSAGLTGSVLVWRKELDLLLHPELLRVAPAGRPLPLEEVVAAAARSYPGAAPLRVQVARTATATHEVTLAGAEPLQVYVDPYRGTVLGARGETESFPNALFDLHVHLLSGETGERVMGTAGLLLLVLVVTGVVVWWPGVRRLGDALWVRWRAGWRRVNFDLHRAVGIWGSAFLTMAAVTGSSLVFHDAFMAGLNRITASPPRPAPPAAPPTGAARLPLDSLVRLAGRAVPGGQLTYLTLPARPDAPVTVRTRLPGELHPNGRNFVYLHPETGAVLAVESALRAPAGTRAYNVLYPIHIGRWGGTLTRVLYSLLGLAPAILFVSGCLMWWNRSGRRILRGRATERRERAPAPRPRGSPPRRRPRPLPR